MINEKSAAPGTATNEPPPFRVRWLVIGLGVLVVLAASGAVVASRMSHRDAERPAAASAARRFPDLQQLCYPGGDGITIADGGQTLIIDSQGSEDFSGVTIVALECVLGQIGVTAAVQQHMQSTRALDGRQEDSWPGYRASWTYHPDNGLDIVVQMV